MDKGYGTAELSMGNLHSYYSWKKTYDYVIGGYTTTEKEWVGAITTAIWKNMLTTETTASS